MKHIGLKQYCQNPSIEMSHAIFLYNISLVFFIFYLSNRLPLGSIVLTGVDAVVPAALHHVEDGLHRDVELGRPANLQLT